LDRACHSYFVKEAAILDYDKVEGQPLVNKL